MRRTDVQLQVRNGRVCGADEPRRRRSCRNVHNCEKEADLQTVLRRGFERRARRRRGEPDFQSQMQKRRNQKEQIRPDSLRKFHHR